MPTVSVNFANITRVVYNGTDYNQLEIRGTQVASKQLWRRVYINSSYPVTEYIDPPPYYERIQESKSFYSYIAWDPSNIDNDNESWPYGTPLEWTSGGTNNWSFEWVNTGTEYNYDGSPNPFGAINNQYYWVGVNYYYDTQYVDPPGYYQTTYVDNSYWAYYY
jgi:hypothetical protein